MTISNALVLVDREMVSSHIEGVDFGPDLYCIARSLTAVLLWHGGHSSSVNGHVTYAGSHLIALPSRAPMRGGWLQYKRLGRESGRLTPARLLEVEADIAVLFPQDGAAVSCASAVKRRETLLIEGGGPALMPSRKLGREAYLRWHDTWPRGLIVAPSKI